MGQHFGKEVYPHNGVIYINCTIVPTQRDGVRDQLVPVSLNGIG